jgi:hypothetical protein
MSSGSDRQPDGRGDAAKKNAGKADPDSPVLLASLWDPVEAEIIMAKLRSAGIECFLRHESASVIYGLTVDGLGQQDIMVRSEDLEVARAALEEE